ncbi:hypothetical protein FRC19_005639, partial [Serendipita sp. 401]
IRERFVVRKASGSRPPEEKAPVAPSLFTSVAALQFRILYSPTGFGSCDFACVTKVVVRSRDWEPPLTTADQSPSDTIPVGE